MAIGIITAICSILAMIIGIWKWRGRVNAEKRRLADEAKSKLDKANSPDGSASDFLDGFDDASRLR